MKSTYVLRTLPAAGDPLQGGLFLEGEGRGHGVGLCQVGGRALANEGWSALRILTHYYPGARLGRVDGLDGQVPEICRSGRSRILEDPTLVRKAAGSLRRLQGIREDDEHPPPRRRKRPNARSPNPSTNPSFV